MSDLTPNQLNFGRIHQDMIAGPCTLLGYELGDVIGEGGQAKVRIAANTSSGELCAIKIIKKRSNAHQEGTPTMDFQQLQKEIRIHKALSHENIIQLFTTKEDDIYMYLVMELAAGGELFDRIEPDVGIEEELAHMYFQQLVAGTMYLHQRGVSHRDLKPENMLLDASGNLKISDFGFATIFRLKDKERILTTPCGTPPYVAPEIHRLQYHGELVDIWSAGIILYVLLAGNTPWAEPTHHDEEFKFFVSRYPRYMDYAPWNHFSDEVLELLLGILNVNAASRFTWSHIQKNRWFSRPNPMLTDGKCNDPAALAQRLKMQHSDPDEAMMEMSQPISYSQPMDIRMNVDSPDFDFSQRHSNHQGIMSFSQPYGTHMGESPTPNEGRFMGSLSQANRGGIHDIFQSERLTRFYSPCDADVIFEQLTACLDSFLVPYKIHPKLLKLTFSTVDKRKCQLHGEISIQPLNSDTHMISFRKSKGDPLEFKRFYKAVKEGAADIL